ncbi:MAG: hypothetical protein WC928_02310 [Patescibacteria group bacterium]|jgi:hypothetical protein
MKKLNVSIRAKIAFAICLAIAIVLGTTSCKKMEFGGPYAPLPDNNNNYYSETFNWQGCNPRPIESLGKIKAEGWSNVFDYSFRISLDGSSVDPNPLSLSSFSIPHVGPNGITIYNNVDNDATYTINKIQNGWVYYTIRSESGHTLKYNISKMPGAIPGDWFLKHGLSHDDGINNMISFTTY